MTTPTRITGNEPDGSDMAQDPEMPGDAPAAQPADPGLAEEEEAAELGDFA